MECRGIKEFTFRSIEDDNKGDVFATVSEHRSNGSFNLSHAVQFAEFKRAEVGSTSYFKGEIERKKK